ncbi:MAG: serine--tRNA ligase [Flavobacteriales bacterium]|nr:serine--tRNA ligase [Flavobacteriales bacterium]|tara:strand:- start:4552 stop:5823 length:1272 start_codon:yes stop_codon:yes gene_type:complete
MLQVKHILENKEQVIKGLNKRNLNAEILVQQIIDLDSERRASIAKVEEVRAEGNKMSKAIGGLFKEGKNEEANQAKTKVQEAKIQQKKIEDTLNEIEDKFTDLLYNIPNVPHDSVPSGNSEKDNEEICNEGVIPNLHEGAKPHWELIKEKDIVDFETGVKITGAGFPVYKGKGAKLQRALINFFLDEADQGGYAEVIPPLLINESSGIGTGQLPDKEGQMYHIAGDDLYLIPTAEVPITNIYRDLILKEDELPKKNCGYTPCFRREAGSYGKEVRGLNRLHQFDKVEIVQVVHPDKSYDVLNEMVEHVKELVRKLKLPFRILRLCGGDLSSTSALTFDFEVYSTAQERWLEVSSVSNFETYQSQRLKLRFRKGIGKPQLAHTLNGSALALPRIMAALIENNQNENGDILIPEVLQKYTGFDII